MTPVDREVAKELVANGAPAAGDKKAKEASAQPDDEMEEVVDEPAIFVDPFITEICRFIEPLGDDNSPLQRLTVLGYINSVKTKWAQYRGDVLHLETPFKSLFFKVLKVRTDDLGNPSLVVQELTSNAEFDGCFLALTPQDLANLCDNEEMGAPNITIYAPGSVYAEAHWPEGIPGLKDLEYCADAIEEAFQDGKLFSWTTRACGLGPWAKPCGRWRGSKLMCSMPTTMKNREFRVHAKSIQFKHAMLELVQAMWMHPAPHRNHLATQSWGQTEVDLPDIQQLAEEAYMNHEAFFDGPFISLVRWSIRRPRNL